MSHHSVSSAAQVAARFLAALLCASLGRADVVQAQQVARMEIHAFQTQTLSDQQVLRGSSDGPPVIISGELRLPSRGLERVPVVVLVHGSGGVSGFVTDWEQDLNALGIATFVLDSFTGRGIVSTVNDQSQLGSLALIVDAYRALDLLAQHPRIDSTRVVLMGFSKGGTTTLYAGLKRMQRLHGHPGREFAGYLAFYPGCLTLRDDEDVADRPIRVFHGNQDDYNPITPCRAYVQRLMAHGKDVRLSEYPDAGHVFDWKSLRTPLRMEQAQTIRHCDRAEGADGMILNARTGVPFSWSDACVERGTSLSYNEAAALDAQRSVHALLAEWLHPK